MYSTKLKSISDQPIIGIDIWSFFLDFCESTKVLLFSGLAVDQFKIQFDGKSQTLEICIHV